MSNSTKAVLKSYFETGDFPTQSQFSDLIDNIPEWIEVSLTAAQIRTLSSIRVDTGIPLPGVGKAIQIISVAAKYTYVSQAFTSQLLYLIADTSANVCASGLDLKSTSSQFGQMLILSGGGMGTANSSIIENKKIFLAGSEDSATGDGTAKFYILYRTITI